jgi:hypothetical protein
MSTWIIVSWVCVLILTTINVLVFLKLKQASEQMMKMAFPGAKNMSEAVSKMQQMTQGLSRGPRAGGAGGGNMDAQLKAAMNMLQQMQKGGKR